MRSFLSITSFALAITVSSFAAATTEITPVPPQAAFRVAAVQIRVVPDHRDWSYQLGEPAKFRVNVVADGEPIENVNVSYVVSPELMVGETKSAVVPLEGLVIDGGTMKEPGFLRCIVTTEIAGHSYKGVATAAFSPEKITPYQTEPADFDTFWKAQLAELANIPVEPVITLMPEACTSKINVYHVGLRTVGPNWTKVSSRVFGILCEPKAPGKYPAVLRVPGAGVRSYSGDKGTAEKGAITLEIGIHGIPVNLPDQVYDQLSAGALNGYPTFNLGSRDAYYYRRVYLSCVRANDFLTSREIWDGKNLVVSGASQGGQLSLVTAALDPRVTGLTVTHPAFCDVVAELHGRAGGWPHMFKPDLKTGKPSEHATPTEIATSAYYDSVNFARRVKVPGYYNWGYNDDVCPPTSTYAAYNVITAPKTLGLTLELAHSYNQEQWDAINGWIANAIGLK